MPLFLSPRTQKLYNEAEELSKAYHHFFLGTEHIFLVILKQEDWLNNALADLGVSNKELEDKILAIAQPQNTPATWEGIIETPRFKLIMKMAEEAALALKAYQIEPLHIILAILKEHKGVPARVLSEMGVDLKDFSEKLKSQPLPSERDKAKEEKKAGEKKLQFLTRFGRDLTNLAKEGKMDPVIGRQDEILRVLQILTRKTKNNPVLIGEAGVGKTAVVYGLALRIAKGEVPSAMRDKKIIELTMANIVAGTKHRGEFEERLQRIIEEVGRAPEVILFIDEIHTIMGAGDTRGGMDASNILKPSLARGEFPCIGATTTNEYHKYIESDPALERRFQPVLVNEPSEEDTLAILKGLRERYEKHHGVKFTDAALLTAVKLSVRYLPDRNLPDKAIDLIDEAAAKVKMNSAAFSGKVSAVQEVNEENIAEVVASWTGIPIVKLTQEESERLLHIEEILMQRVIGQEEAIKTIAQTIRMVRVGLSNPNRPSGVFLCLGPTGVGKTELAKTLAEFLFGSDKDMVRLDMSEYMEKHSIARLIGAPPGYVGYEEEGQLTKAVRTKPYSVVLLDEIEKAHPEVFDIFLQVFDDGRLTDGKGRTVNFTNTIILLTSNLGTSQVDEQGNVVLRDIQKPEVKEEIMKAVRKAFRPEFINRIDEILIFNPLTQEALRKIVDINLAELKKRMQEKEIELDFKPEVIELLMQEGYNPAYGARPLKRAIASLLAKPLAEEMLAQGFKAKDIVRVSVENGKIAFKVEVGSERSLPDHTIPEKEPEQ
jgi:ATP-dependent Clp protease ATP-binding subunit ClpC